MIGVAEYIDKLGRNAFLRWFRSIPSEAQSRITLSLDRVKRGNTSSLKSVQGGVFELRLDFGPGYRVYCGQDGDTLVILLGGGTKKRQQVDIEEAKGLWREYKQRKREETDNATNQRLR